MKKAEEKWSVVPWLLPSVEVSTEGRVRKYINGVDTEIVELSEYNGLKCFNFMGKTIQVHRAVASAFIPNPEGLTAVKHKNGNKLDNSVENLEWGKMSTNFANSKIWRNRIYCKELDCVFGSLHTACCATGIPAIYITDAMKEYTNYKRIVKLAGLSFQLIEQSDETYDDHEVIYIEASEGYELLKNCKSIVKFNESVRSRRDH